MKRNPFTIQFLYLAVVGSMLLFGMFAWWSTRSQLRSIWENARTESGHSAPGLAENVGRGFEQQLTSIPTYQEPPDFVPSPQKDAVLAGTDLEALRSLSWDRTAGFTQEGLPRQAVAALRIHDLYPNELSSDPGFLSGEIPFSPLTREYFDTVENDPYALEAWKKSEVIRKLADDNLRSYSSEAQVWIDSDAPVFIRRMNGDLEYYMLPTKHFIGYPDIPNWQDIHVSIGGPLEDERVLASAAVIIPRFSAEPEGTEESSLAWSQRKYADVRNGLWLNILALPRKLEAPVRRQQRWALALFAFALLTSGLALLSIHRTLRRQRQLNEMKSQFVASASHELRAPVASIRLMADALESQKFAPETVKEFHRLIARECARLSTLVANVLDHARIEQGSKVWNMQPCDLTALTTDTLRLMEPLALEKEITLTSELSPVDASVDADAMQQALINLLDNAIKFSPPGSKIATRLIIHKDSNCWQLEVHDEGPGIPVAEQSRIFERFYRLGDELRRETQGTGIGLSLVKSISEAHGGTVSLESKPGRGCNFTLTFPL